jgi:membrane protein DedA with SNARE-associated domain
VPAWLLDLFAHYGYAAVFLGVFLENTGLPVPGETMVLAGGALAQAGSLKIGWVIATATVAAICGDNLGFFIGRRGGRVLAERYGWRVGLTPSRLAHFDQFFLRYGPATVFIARFVTGLRVVCAVLAGASELSWPTFLFYNAAGAIVWSTTIAAAGYALAGSWERLEQWIGRTGLIALAAVGVLVVIGVLRARRQASS